MVFKYNYKYVQLQLQLQDKYNYKFDYKDDYKYYYKYKYKNIWSAAFPDHWKIIYNLLNAHPWSEKVILEKANNCVEKNTLTATLENV